MPLIHAWRPFISVRVEICGYTEMNRVMLQFSECCNLFSFTGLMAAAEHIIFRFNGRIVNVAQW